MVSPVAIKRIQWLIWILIYGGLLTIVLATFVSRSAESLAWWMTAGGGLLVSLGIVLIYVRSRLKVST